MRRHTLISLMAATALLSAACGGSTPTDTTDGGDDGDLAGNITLQDEVVLDETTTSTTTTIIDETAGGATESVDGSAEDEAVDGDSATEDTIPQAEIDPDEEFFTAVTDFMGCMDQSAGGFIGIPDGGDERDESLPHNAPAYIDALVTCAANTNIQEKMAAAEDTSRFTPEEVEERNEGFLAFRECLIGRGWTIPEPTPDENGMLFGSDYVAAATEWVAPDGESLIDGDDTQECSEGFSLDDEEDEE